MAYYNQRKIIIERSSNNERKNYWKVSNQNLQAAMYNLSPSAFMLWVYFCDNADGYYLDLYPVHFQSITGLSRSTYDRAFLELREAGYLVQHNKSPNVFLFREVSAKAKQPDTIISKSADEIDMSGFTQNDKDAASN